MEIVGDSGDSRTLSLGTGGDSGELGIEGDPGDSVWIGEDAGGLVGIGGDNGDSGTLPLETGGDSGELGIGGDLGDWEVWLGAFKFCAHVVGCVGIDNFLSIF